MEHIIIINRISLFFIVCLFTSCSTSNDSIKESRIYGNWVYVKHYGWRATKYTSDQLDILKKAELRITKNSIKYEGVGFINECDDIQWQISVYDTSITESQQMELYYTKEELSQVYLFNPVSSSTGQWEGCFSDCAIFYLKQDTLINICGGFPIYLIRK